jgi:hypothetical protein
MHYLSSSFVFYALVPQLYHAVEHNARVGGVLVYHEVAQTFELNKRWHVR